MDLIKKTLPILFLFLFSFCTTTVDNNNDNGTNNTITVVIKDAWFDDILDYDQDGYVSSAALYFDIETDDNIDLVIVIGYKLSSNASYDEYFTSEAFEVDGLVSKFVPIGDTYGELPFGAYDFLLQVFQAGNMDNVIVEVSAGSLMSLKGLLFEERADDPAFIMQLKNNVFTDITISVDGFFDEVLAPQDSINYPFTENPGTFSYTAATSGKTNTGSVIGLELSWDYSEDVSNRIFKKIDLIITQEFFFAYMRNNGSAALSPVYVNYGRAEQTMDNVWIPNDGVTYRLGYYRAFNDTQVRAPLDGTGSDVIWNQGVHFFFPWTNNQAMIFTNSNLSKTVQGDTPDNYGWETLIPGEIPAKIHLSGESRAAQVK